MRPHSILPALLLFAFSAACAAPAGAAEPPPQAPACLVMEQGWIRLPPAPRPMLAGFGRLANRCKGELGVVAVRSPRFGEVSLHETRVVDGVSRMRELERLPIAAGAEALLQPGGLHLMLMQPDAVLLEGEKVPLVLVLDDGRELAATLVVAKSAPGR